MIIERNTAFKDDGFHEIHDALSRFLYGSEDRSDSGQQWGISSFAPVWESLCLTYAIEHRKNEIVACDTTGLCPELCATLQQLPNVQEYRDESKILARMHTTLGLASAFVINGIKLFPDCVFAIDLLEQLKSTIYARYKVRNLCDIASTCAQLVELKFRPLWQSIKYRNGPTQRTAAPNLLALVQSSTPNGITSFLLGRAIAAAYESTNGAHDSREKIFDQMISHKLASPSNTDLLLGIIWETYFNKSDQLRSEESLRNRKNLHGFKYAMTTMSSFVSKPDQFEYILYFENQCNSLANIRNNGYPDPYLIVDFKYYTMEYFDSDHTDVRERSIRKQFVYEHLLEKSSTAHCAITSEFWIPAFAEASDKVELDSSISSYVGKSIPIRRLNLAKLMEIYRDGSTY